MIILKMFFKYNVKKNNIFKIFKKFNWYLILNIKGLGFRFFIYKKNLYVQIGYKNLLKIKKINNILIFCRKKNIYILGYTKESFYNFINFLKYFKKYNCYNKSGIIFKDNIGKHLKKKKKLKNQYI